MTTLRTMRLQRDRLGAAIPGSVRKPSTGRFGAGSAIAIGSREGTFEAPSRRRGFQFSQHKSARASATRKSVSPRLVECAKADGNAQLDPFIVIGLETAMRKSEILSIRREDIDLQRRIVFIPKAKAGHTVDVRKPFRRVVSASGLDPDQTLRHTLRHTASTQLVQSGVDLPTVKRISGHKTLAMVERYSHQNGTPIQAAMDKLQARFKLAS